MNIDRLNTLADFLDTVPVEKFNMADWRTNDNHAYDEDMLTDSHLTQMNCNTAGCAIGWACVIPEFRAAGFAWESEDHSGYPVFKSENGWFAVEDFFGLSPDQGYTLFDAASYDELYRTPDSVANRIRAMVSTAYV